MTRENLDNFKSFVSQQMEPFKKNSFGGSAINYTALFLQRNAILRMGLPPDSGGLTNEEIKEASDYIAEKLKVAETKIE